MNRTGSFITAAFVVAIIGCDTGTGPQIDVCPEQDGVQLEGPCVNPVREVIASFTSPVEGFKVTQGDTFSCKLEVVKKNVPDDVRIDTLITFGGVQTGCESIVANLEPGIYELKAKVCVPNYGLCTEAKVSVEVTAKPKFDQILVRIVEATYPDWGCADIWTADAVPGAKPHRLTTGCNKGTFAVSVSRDGKTLWYTESGTNRIWKSELDGSNPVTIPVVWNGQPVTNITNLRVSPDGSRISFTIIALDGDTRVLVMNADGTEVQSLVDVVFGVYTVGIGSAWMPDSRRIMVVRDSSGTIDGTFRTVQNEYLLLDLETGEKETIYVAKYGEDQYNSILRGISDDSDWSLIWEIRNTGRATVVRTDGSGEVRPLTERLKNASYPFFCGEAVCAASKKLSRA